MSTHFIITASIVLALTLGLSFDQTRRERQRRADDSLATYDQAIADFQRQRDARPRIAKSYSRIANDLDHLEWRWPNSLT